jgi:hypothetical protein
MRIPPKPEPLFAPQIFIPDIQPADITYHPVNNRYFAVVAEIYARDAGRREIRHLPARRDKRLKQAARRFA